MEDGANSQPCLMSMTEDWTEVSPKLSGAIEPIESYSAPKISVRVDNKLMGGLVCF